MALSKNIFANASEIYNKKYYGNFRMCLKILEIKALKDKNGFFLHVNGFLDVFQKWGTDDFCLYT